jgi:hypothetical protein
VYSWAKTWKNEAGFVVTYFMSYHVRPVGAQAARLEIEAIRMSPDTANTYRAALEKVKPRRWST